MPIIIVIILVLLGVGLEKQADGKLSFKHKFIIWRVITFFSCFVTHQLNENRCVERIERAREKADERVRASIMTDLIIQELKEQKSKAVSVSDSTKEP